MSHSSPLAREEIDAELQPWLAMARWPELFGTIEGLIATIHCSSRLSILTSSA